MRRTATTAPERVGSGPIGTDEAERITVEVADLPDMNTPSEEQLALRVNDVLVEDDHEAIGWCSWTRTWSNNILPATRIASAIAS